jgi:hypothetical protein
MALVLTWPVGRAGTETRDTRAPLGPVAAYALASLLGGAATGFALAQAAAVVRGASASAELALVIAAAGIGAAAVVLQWLGRLRPLPERSAQVPRGWLLWRSRTHAAAAFGLVIGSGALTHLKHAAAYVLAALVVLAPSVEAGVLVGALYGASRGMTLVVTWLSDSFLGRRVRWPRVATASTQLNRMLAIAAVTSLGVAVIGVL